MIYKLKYPDKKAAIADLKAKGCLDEDGEKKPLPTHNVVFIGKIIEKRGTYDEEGNQLTAPTFLQGCHVDVMDDRDIDFGENRKFPKIEHHKF